MMENIISGITSDLEKIKCYPFYDDIRQLNKNIYKLISYNENINCDKNIGDIEILINEIKTKCSKLHNIKIYIESIIPNYHDRIINLDKHDILFNCLSKLKYELYILVLMIKKNHNNYYQIDINKLQNKICNDLLDLENFKNNNNNIIDTYVPLYKKRIANLKGIY